MPNFRPKTFDFLSLKLNFLSKHLNFDQVLILCVEQFFFVKHLNNKPDEHAAQWANFEKKRQKTKFF